MKKLFGKGRLSVSAQKLARSISWDLSHTGQPNFLCMGRAVFNQDIEALKAGGDFNYSTIRASDFENAIANFIDKKHRRQTFFHKKFEDMDEDLKNKISSYICDFLEKANNFERIDAIIAGNSDYWQDEPLKLACKQMDLPFIVLNRENYIQQYEWDFLVDRIKAANFRFDGDLMCVASQRCRDVLMDTGAYSSSHIVTTGWPRNDRYGNSPPQKDNKLLVTLMAYQDRLYLAPENFLSVLDEFIDMARKHSDRYKFVIKVKKVSHARRIIRARPMVLFSRIQLEWKALSCDVVRQSRIVIGYNTTGVVEALLTNADIIVPWWADAVQPQENLLISAHSEHDRKVFHFVESRRAFAACIENALNRHKSEVARKTRREVFDRYIHWPAEGACRAFEKAVSQLLASRD